MTRAMYSMKDGMVLVVNSTHPNSAITDSSGGDKRPRLFVGVLVLGMDVEYLLRVEQSEVSEEIVALIVD